MSPDVGVMGDGKYTHIRDLDELAPKGEERYSECLRVTRFPAWTAFRVDEGDPKKGFRTTYFGFSDGTYRPVEESHISLEDSDLNYERVKRILELDK